MLTWGQKALQAQQKPADCKAKAKANKAKAKAAAAPPNQGANPVEVEVDAADEIPDPVPVPNAGVYSMRRHKRKTATGEVKVFAIQSAGKQCAQLTTNTDPDAERIISDMVSELNEQTTTLDDVKTRLNMMKGNVWDALMYIFCL